MALHMLHKSSVLLLQLFWVVSMVAFETIPPIKQLDSKQDQINQPENFSKYNADFLEPINNPDGEPIAGARSSLKNLEDEIEQELTPEEELEQQAEAVKSSKFEKEKEKPQKMPLMYIGGDSEFRFSAKFRPEFFYGKNLRLLNNHNQQDQVAYFRHTIDLVGEYHFGKASRGYDVAMLKMDLRNRGIWGDPESISLTTESEIKRLDVVSLAHRHGIPRHIFWLRELWLQISLNDIVPWCPENFHTLTIGAFPFELGRGIALGSAYGIGPDLLGFYAENAIDQYAFGFKFSGDICKSYLTYDVYAAILDNKASTFDHTNAKIRIHEFGKKFTPIRGFGIINYVTAARLRWTPRLANEKYSVLIEPYILFNDQREQKIEFLGDSHSKLGTAGLAGEFELGNLDFGFDTAFNFGFQQVKGIDRNLFTEENRNGFEVIANNKVQQIDPKNGKKAPALKVEENQKIIDRSPQCERENGKVIGSNSLGTLINDTHRFADPYRVKYNGSMFVFDIGYYLCNPEFKVNAAFGYASGGDNPHKDLEHVQENLLDFTYDGFVSLLELYSGTRVKSAYLLSGSGRIPRVLSFPSEEVADPFPSTVARFTNLVFVGSSAQFTLPNTVHKWNINPNVFAFWNEIPTMLCKPPKKNNKNSGKSSDKKIKKKLHKHHPADSFLGIEFNTFFEVELLPDLRFFAVGAFFTPGKHFDHIKGMPLNKDQKKFVDAMIKADLNAVTPAAEVAPLLGNDFSWYINAGLEYKF